MGAFELVFVKQSRCQGLVEGLTNFFTAVATKRHNQHNLLPLRDIFFYWREKCLLKSFGKPWFARQH